MKEIFLLKLGEIVLKGANKRQFENKLRQNVRRRMKRYGNFDVYILQSTVYVEPLDDQADVDGAWEACRSIFGVVSLCRCRPCEKSLDAIFSAIENYLGDDLDCAKSFKVESKRSDKAFPRTSIQLSREIGGRLAEAHPGWRWTCTIRNTRCMWRCGTCPPTSTAPRSRARAVCPPVWADGPWCCSPAASTPRWRRI